MAVFKKEEIAEFAHHKDNLKTALKKMCKSIIAAKKASKGSTEEVDEIQLVQEKLHIFLADILPVAEAIIVRIEDTTIPSQSNNSRNSSSTTTAPSKLIVERQSAYEIDSTCFEVREVSAGGGGGGGGLADFGFQHRDFAGCSSTLLEAKKTQLQLETTVTLAAEAQQGIAQAGIQMLGEIQKLGRFFNEPITKYCSMLTNGLVWMQVLMSGGGGGNHMRWIHSGPIVVIEEQKKGEKYSIKKAAVDLVADNILSVLLTAKSLLQLAKEEPQKFASKSKVGLFFMLRACFLYCMYVCMYCDMQYSFYLY